MVADFQILGNVPVSKHSLKVNDLTNAGHALRDFSNLGCTLSGPTDEDVFSFSRVILASSSSITRSPMEVTSFVLTRDGVMPSGSPTKVLSKIAPNRFAISSGSFVH